MLENTVKYKIYVFLKKTLKNYEHFMLSIFTFKIVKKELFYKFIMGDSVVKNLKLF